MDNENLKWFGTNLETRTTKGVDTQTKINEILETLKQNWSNLSKVSETKRILELFNIKTLNEIDNIWDFNEYWVAIFQKGDKFGIVNIKGKIILDANNKKITLINKYFIAESTENGIGPDFIKCSVYDLKWQLVTNIQKHKKGIINSNTINDIKS
jgi:glycerol-3-phosphate responsive antiterminator